MQDMMFTPQRRDGDKDVVSDTLSKVARIVLITTLSLSPIFFLPAAYMPFNFSKVLFVIIGVLIALIFHSLSMLREGRVNIVLSPPFYSVWVLAAATALAAVFSGDIHDSFFGDEFGVHTAIFIALLALIVSTVPILQKRKANIMHFYIVLTGAALFIGVYHVLRFVFGADFLSFGVFTAATSTPLGGWNDLAIFYGLSLILSLIAIEQFPLTRLGRIVFSSVAILALTMLAAVNFYAIWIILGLVSLVVLMYTLTRNRFSSATPVLSDDLSSTDGVIASSILSIIVFVVSIVFVIGGSSLSQSISKITDVSYVEVRPSVSATVDIARSVYSENAFTGIGPNRFMDAWVLHKDPSINQTIFWNTPFASGSGYIPTFAVTSGILGILAWLLFLGCVLYVGLRVLFTSQPVDRYWYFLGSSSFASSLYLWGMAILYVPGPVILILTAVFTGVLFTTYLVVVPQKRFSVSLLEYRQAGFALVAFSMVIIVGSVAVIYYSARQYSSLVSFNRAFASIQEGASIESLEQQIANSYQISANDRFARELAGIQISKMNTLMALTEPTEAQQQQFKISAENAIQAAQLAVQTDPTNAQNRLIEAAVFSILAGAGVEGAYDRSKQALDVAGRLAPVNPEVKLLAAQLESRTGNLETSRERALEAIQLKTNYTDALYFLTQLDIARGDVESAIATTQATITLEPRNAARYYQLGILYASNNDINSAVRAFETAVQIDPNYANARYFLALAYSELGRPEEAKAQLEVVRSLNPDVPEVAALIGRLNSGETIQLSSDGQQVVPETEASVGEGGDVVTTEDPDSPLLTPVNTVPNESETQAETETDTDTAPEANEEVTEETPAE